MTVGRASAFLDLLCSEIPETILTLARALADEDLDAAYRRMPVIDFSRAVLNPRGARPVWLTELEPHRAHT